MRTFTLNSREFAEAVTRRVGGAALGAARGERPALTRGVSGRGRAFPQSAQPLGLPAEHRRLGTTVVANGYRSSLREQD